MAGSGNQGSRNRFEILQRFEDCLQHSCSRLSVDDLPVRENAHYNKDEFWQHFVSATKLVSHEATKLCMAFESNCGMSDEECQCLVDKVEKACLTLFTVFLKLPKEQGLTLHRRIRLYVLYLLNGMICLCNAVKRQRYGLQNVGDIWAHCETVENLPRDNKEVVLEICEQQHEMVQDAIQELMDAMENENAEVEFPINDLQMPPHQTWSSSDRNILLPCSGLLKAAKACVKKTKCAISARGDGSHEESIQELDRIADIIKESSNLADDFVLALYLPVNHSIAREQAMRLRNNFKELLSAVRSFHFCSASDEIWIEFLEKAVDHNWVRINDMVLAE